MINTSTMSKWTFLFKGIVYGPIAMLWYTNLLFRCLDGHTYRETRTFLWVMLAVSIVLGTFVSFRYNRTNWAEAACLIIPFGLYTVFAYSKTIEKIIIITLSAAVGLAVIYSVFCLARRVKNKKSTKKIIKNRLYRCFCVTHYFVSAGMMIIMLILGLGKISGAPIMSASAEAYRYRSDQEQTIKNNIEIISLLQEDKWKELSVKERLNVLQTVANIEAYYLGLPNELNVVADNLNEHTLGSYSDEKHTIYLNLAHIENDSVYEVLETCCHEAYHSYQHRLIDAYKDADEKFRSLSLYKQAAAYAAEFDNYVDGYEDILGYYYQDCESDAREYAENAVNDYYEKIARYLEEEQ